MQTVELIASFLGGGAVQSIINYGLNHRKTKIDEAKIVAELSAQLRAELFQRYEERGKTITKLRMVIIKLTNFIDALVPRITGITTSEVRILKDLTLETRLAGLAAEV